MKMRKPGRGQTLVEYALMLPLMILIILFLLDAGRAVYYYSVIHNAVREGARYGIINPEDFAGIETSLRNLTTGLDASALDVPDPVLTWNDDSTRIVKITVSASYSFAPVTPLVGNFFSGGTLTLQSQSTMNVEG
jgi:hypothetical protein